MATTRKWLLLVVLGLVVSAGVAGCVYNDDDDDDDSGQVSGSGEARGSPGWGLLGSLGAVAAVGMLLRRRMA